ncbi:papain-like cysteine protease family protein [Rhizobium rhizogenes]|uniref:papain-like cysteine protease family protein n=1 Tax=Rhizobium rhizogenes TaxID=359 RepID=UPI0022BC5B3B|nr:papain-like cysteine protease family protein [Rhizobium rhizogenes]MCZ7480544.1 hypothetical protein [Rhizobium rhizogenes]
MKIQPADVLDVRFIQQDTELDCGAAAFEMVYRFLRPSKLSKFDRKKFFARYRKSDPHVRDSLRIDTDDLVAAGLNRGLKSRLCVAFPTEEGMVNMFKGLLYNDRVPIIVCQRLSDEMALCGHFRVVIGCTDTEVIFHDPLGGNSVRWPVSQFFDYFKRTGENVAGGICVIISKDDITTPVYYDQGPWIVMSKKLDKFSRIAPVQDMVDPS